MDNLYVLMIAALAILAIADLIVGVSNDAVNFLNSAIGSKAVSFKTIMIVASVGIAAGAIFSSGMMEVARKGIFDPSMFYFDDIMIIFMSVMITDILLLDLFNTLGMPTSTTVSIVFELLGAAVCIALLKIGADNTQTFADLSTYINTEKAGDIIEGILLSVVIAFSVGAFVQWVSRLLLTFHFEKKANWVGSLFGSIGLTAITYFIFMKGIKGTPYASKSIAFLGNITIKEYLESEVLTILLISSVFWFIFSYIYTGLLKNNIYKLIILVGTFALALAFAGNDLVNFVGVPIAAWNSYQAFIDPLININNLSAMEFPMDVLAEKVPTPTLLLFISGIIMVATLWFSSKSKNVLKTSIDLSSQEDTKERFQPNFLSRGIVRSSMYLSKGINYIIPNSIQNAINSQFKTRVISLPKSKEFEVPAFDMVRAAVNLMVAGILISIATSMKLPLSTTYVTFMVAMGTSLADRAWGSESAVYRVAGVLNVIGGWFLTAITAFTAAAIMAILIKLGGSLMIALLLLLALVLLTRNALKHRKEAAEDKVEVKLKKSESKSIQGLIEETSDNITTFVNRSSKIYSTTLDGLAKQDLTNLKKSKKGIAKLNDEVEDLRNSIFYFIKNLDESSVGASNFYINALGYLEDMAQSLEYISKVCYKHVNNNHKKMKFNQIKDLKEIEQQLHLLFDKIKETFKTRNFDKISSILNEKQELFDKVSVKIEKQVARTRTEETSPKNTTLYFSVLLETKDLISGSMNLLELYYKHTV